MLEEAVSIPEAYHLMRPQVAELSKLADTVEEAVRETRAAEEAEVTEAE